MEQYWEFIKNLKVEPYVLLYIFACDVYSVVSALLLQEKLCRNVYHRSKEFCIDLNEINPEDDPDNYKDQILAVSAQFNLYLTLISTLPTLMWCLFFGPWIDKYIHGSKVLMCATSLSGIIESTLLIVNAVYFDLSMSFLWLCLFFSHIYFLIFLYRRIFSSVR